MTEFVTATPISNGGSGPNDVPRDGHGRYQAPRYPMDRPMLATEEPIQGQGMMVPYMRVSTMAGTSEDGFGIGRWQLRMTVKGMAIRPDLIALGAATKVTDSRTLDSVADQAMDAAAAKASSNLGTALHGFTDQVDSGEAPFIPAPWDIDIAAYTAALAEAGITLIPGLQELRVVRPDVRDGSAAGMMGTFDRIVMWNGQPTVADLKTGSNPLKYGACKIATQLWSYASAWAIWDGQFWHPMPANIRLNKALVIHLPAGSGACKIEEVDLGEEEEAIELNMRIRARRNRKDHLHRPVVVVADGVVSAPAEDYPQVSGVTALTEVPAERGVVVADGVVSAPAEDYPQVSGVTALTEVPAEREIVGVATSGPGAPDHAAKMASAGVDGLGQPLAPIAQPGQRGCSVCSRTGHRKGSVKCLGADDPIQVQARLEAAQDTYIRDNHPALSAALANDETNPNAAWCMCTNRSGGWHQNPEDPEGPWICGDCGLQSRAGIIDGSGRPLAETANGFNGPNVVTVATMNTADGPVPITMVPPTADEILPDPFAPVTPPAAVEPTWEELITASKDVAALRAIGVAAMEAGVWTPERKALGLARMAELSR